MKYLFCISLLFLFFAANAQESNVDTNFHIYLLIGQSNMAGRGIVDEESKKSDPRILMLTRENQWVAATDPMHFDKPGSAGVGPGLNFAKEMLRTGNKIKIGLIPSAWGGSPIKVWQPGAEYLKIAHPYDDAVVRTRLAMKQGVLKGILWHQGESDNDSARASVYLDKLGLLITRLRTDLQQPAIPFVAGEIGYFNRKNFINPIIHKLSDQVPFTAVVKAVDLTDKGDQLHFDTPSARELGKRYAVEMKKLQVENKLVKDVKE